MNTKRLNTAVLLVGAAVCALSAPALGQQNNVRNEQRSWAEARAELNAEIQNVTGDVSATSAAIGNSFSAELAGSSSVRNFQDGWRNASADLNIDAMDIEGSVSATAAAIGNSASISIDANQGDAGGFAGVNNTQMTHWGRFYSTLNLDAVNVTAPSANDLAVSATSAAIANSLSVDVNGDLTVGGADENIGSLLTCDPGNAGACETGLGNVDQIAEVGGFDNWSANSRQFFRGDSVAKLNASVENVTGAVELTSAALGNSASYNVENASNVKIDSWQFAGYDPQAFSNVEVAAVTGDFTSTTAGISNSFSASTLPTTSLTVNNTQLNRAYTGATANMTITDIVGDVSMTAAAIGNSATISNLPEGL